MTAIKVNGTTEYNNKVKSILDTIARNPIGRVITDFVLKHKKLVTIKPLDKGTAAVISEDNALTHPVNAGGSAPKGASELGPIYWYRGDPDNQYTRGPGIKDDERHIMVPKGVVGTGAGSDIVIKFSPENIKSDRVWDRQADNVLVHELVHALRAMQGLRNPIPTDAYTWMNEEEFFACAIQNVYLSAGGSMRLRGGYVYETRLEEPQDTSSGFLTANLGLFDKHATSWGQVYTGLAFVNTARFNPFREFVGRKL